MKKIGSVFVVFIFLISCSGSSSNNKLRNTISPNDPEFDPDPDKIETQLSDLSEQELLERAEAAYEKQLFSVSRDNWTKLRDTYPGSTYATLAELKIADCYFFTGEYGSAITAYEEFLKLHPAHEAIAYVIYQIGNAYKEQYTGTAHDQGPLHTALKYYKKILSNYPNSEFVTIAKEKIKDCNSNLAAHEAIVARFYEKQRKPQASKERLKFLSTEFAQSKQASWARAKLNLSATEAKETKEKEEEPNPNTEEVTLTEEIPENIPELEEAKEITKPEKIIAKKEEPVEEDLGESFPLRPLTISCDKTDNSTIVTFYFPETVQIIHTQKETSENESIIIALKNNQKDFSENYFSKLSQKDISLDLNCSEKTFSLNAKKLFDKKNKETQFVKFDFQLQKIKESSYFVLDRPDRFIAIFFQ